MFRLLKILAFKVIWIRIYCSKDIWTWKKNANSADVRGLIEPSSKVFKCRGIFQEKSYNLIIFYYRALYSDYNQLFEWSWGGTVSVTGVGSEDWFTTGRKDGVFWLGLDFFLWNWLAHLIQIWVLTQAEAIIIPEQNSKPERKFYYFMVNTVS